MGNLKLDWFTVVVQVLNFFAMVWFLNQFLWRPIYKAIDERKNWIAEELEKAKMESSVTHSKL